MAEAPAQGLRRSRRRALKPAHLRRCPHAMSFLDLLNHLLNLAAPAFVVGLLLALAVRLLFARAPRAPALWLQALLNSAVGLVVILAGLVITGRDGRMGTYVFMVLAIGTAQWLQVQPWKR